MQCLRIPDDQFIFWQQQGLMLLETYSTLATAEELRGQLPEFLDIGEFAKKFN